MNKLPVNLLCMPRCRFPDDSVDYLMILDDLLTFITDFSFKEGM